MIIIIHKIVIISIFLVSFQFMIMSITPSDYLLYSTSSNEGVTAKVLDSDLKVKLHSTGLEAPTSMSFLGSDDILVLEKDKGEVRRITDGQLLDAPILNVNVATEYERGMLGIAIENPNDELDRPPYVFLYYTEAAEEAKDNCPTPNRCEKGRGEPLGYRLYRYELLNDDISNPKLLLDLPPLTTSVHNGGPVLIGPDDAVYVIIGDGDSCLEDNCVNSTIINSQAMNFQDGIPPIGRGGILRVTQDGEVVDQGILGETHPLDKYFAYGIRNSFGMDFDPVTGYLWDTENGPAFGDEINLVEPGFNSGWAKVQGIWPVAQLERGRLSGGYNGTEQMLSASLELVKFDGRGNYSAPKFVWNVTVAPTAIKFLDSDKLGKEYQNEMFVGTAGSGTLYHFSLTEDRTALDLSGPLADNTANNWEELKDIEFGTGFGKITDIEVGPDGYLYILSYDRGSIYKIYPKGIE
jgi:glucose/arabinose dehydrogenase